MGTLNQSICDHNRTFYARPSLFQRCRFYLLCFSCSVICPFRVSTNCDVVTYILNANFRSQNVICRNVTSQLWCNLLSTYKTTCARLAFGPNSAPTPPYRCVQWHLARRWKEILACEIPHQRWRDVATPINFWWAIISLMKGLKSKTNFVIAVMIHEHQGLLTVSSGWHFD